MPYFPLSHRPDALPEVHKDYAVSLHPVHNPDVIVRFAAVNDSDLVTLLEAHSHLLKLTTHTHGFASHP